MAKKKKAVKTETKSDDKLSINDVIAGLEKEFGDGIFVSGQEIVERNKKIISFSPKMDMMLGGGIAEGEVVICSGPPKVGKTTACLHFAGMAQKPEHNSVNGPRTVFFHNIEMRLKERDLRGIKHLILSEDRFRAIESKPGNILTAEKHAAIFERLLHEFPGSIFVFDSFSALCTQTRLDASIGTKFRDNYTSILSDMLTRTQPVITMNNSIVLGVTHVVSNTSGFGSNKSETGGIKIQYHSDVKLRATHKEAWRIGSTEDSTQIGQTVHWCCDWSGIGPPGTKCGSLLRYGYGIDREVELIEIASDLGIINKGGSWLTFPDGVQVQGKEKARDYLLENPHIYDDINKKYRDLMGFPNESDKSIEKSGGLEN